MIKPPRRKPRNEARSVGLEAAFWTLEAGFWKCLLSHFAVNIISAFAYMIDIRHSVYVLLLQYERGTYG